MEAKTTSAETPDASSHDGLARVLTPFDAAALGVGIVIGTGIFAVPGMVARELGSPGLVLLAWCVGGVVALAGAFTYAELAAALPRQGGSFVYVLEAFGPFAAFFKGWGSFLVGNPASMAAISTVLGSYLATAAGLGDGAVRPAALGAATLAWLLNLRGTRFSGSLQTALTCIKVGVLGSVAVLALFAGPSSWERLTSAPGIDWPGPAAFLAAMAAALVGITWTFDGWPNLTVVAGEVRDPERNLARALVLAVGVITALYLIVNVGYIVLLPMEQLQASDSVAAAAAESVIGPIGSRLLAGFVVVSSFGALFGIGVTAPRFFFAMARARLFFSAAGRVAGTGAPRWGTTVLWILTVVYILTGTFEQIVSYYVAVSLVYNGLTIAAVFRLRRIRPGLDRPFRVPGYPVVPMIPLLAAAAVLVSIVADDPTRSLAGLGILLASVPTYVAWRKWTAGAP